MNKKMIMLISTLVCANSMVFSAQRGFVKAPGASISQGNVAVVQPLTAEENKKYQTIVKLYKNGWNRDLIDENSIKLMLSEELYNILEKRAAFLKQEIRKPSQLWPYWMALVPAVFPLAMHMYPGYRIGRLIYNVNDALMLPYGTLNLVYTVAPLMAFYGMYKKYSTREEQLQELREIPEMYEQLGEFIRSLFPYGIPMP